MTSEQTRATQAVWTPDQEYLDQSRLLRLMRQHDVETVPDWRRWASADIGRYWQTVVADLDLAFSRPFTAPVDLGAGCQWPRWFVGGKFNYVHNALDRHVAEGRGAQIAVIWEGDDGDSRDVSFGELLDQTNRLANVLTDLGIGRGDVVGIFMPMLPETVAAVLACGKIGAIYTPLFSGFGADAVATRLRDCSARVLLTVDGFYRRGATVPLKSVADAALVDTPTIEHALVYRRTQSLIDWTPDRDLDWTSRTQQASSVCATLETDADERYMVIHTSGTTGRPKGAVHVHAGFPIKAAHDLAYCFDLHANDRLFWYSDLGWMMGPWAIGGGLMLGATIVLFEGTPDYPHPDRIWDLVERYRITHLGLAPTSIRALLPKGDEWPARHDLTSLRILGSTGETWNPDPWQWYFRQIGGGRCPIINYSGGTETGGGIVGCDTISPIAPCSFTGPVPGMDADVVDENGKSVRGAVGELIVRQPWVGMTSGFLNDDARYLETYWSRFPDTWVHGDWAEIDEEGFWYIRGRSDDTLKIAGKRIGPAEVESAAVAHGAVQEAAVIGVPHEIKGETAVVICILKPGHEPTDELNEDIRRLIGRNLGAALRPEKVHFVHELPRTRNAKIMRRVIRAAYLGLPTGDTTALENPAAVELVAQIGRADAGRRHG